MSTRRRTRALAPWALALASIAAGNACGPALDDEAPLLEPAGVDGAVAPSMGRDEAIAASDGAEGGADGGPEGDSDDDAQPDVLVDGSTADGASDGASAREDAAADGDAAPVARSVLERFEDVAFTADAMDAAFARWHATRPTRPTACGTSADAREACTVQVYRAVAQRWSQRFAEPLTFGRLLAIVFRSEVGLMMGYSAAGDGKIVEAFGRNLWQICGAGGCSADRLLRYLASKQGWFVRGRPSGPAAVADSWLDYAFLFEGSVRAAIHDATFRATGAGAGDRPYEWATWGRDQPGYATVLSGCVAGATPASIPVAIRYCAYGQYDYVAAVVTKSQDLALPPPSVSSRERATDAACRTHLIAVDKRCP